jgi:hypothetical protein
VVTDNPPPAYPQDEELTEPVVISGRSHAAFNPASPADVGLFREVLMATTCCLEACL